MQTSNPSSKLIRINAGESFLGDNASSLTEVVMPIDSMLVSAAVISMFLMFAEKKYPRTTLRFVPEDSAGNIGMSRDLSDAAMERSLESQDAQK